MIKPGDILDGIYRIDSEIGEGGIGVIYLGYHLRLHKQIVIKKIKENFIGKIKERSEVDILKQLHHTNLPQVYDFVQKDSVVFTVMDYIEGEDLSSYLKNNKKPEEKQVFLWLSQLCEVLEYLHSRKPAVIHNDIKPQNIMLRPDGSICLLDFNISFDKENRVISGYTKRYASPELIQSIDYAGKTENNSKVQVDERSDIYSVGATMYHLVSGIAPDFWKKPVQDLQTMNLPYSRDLLRIIMKARSFLPQDRYASISDMLGDLRNIITRDKELQKLKRVEKTYYGCCVLFLLAGLTVSFWGAKNIQKEKFIEDYQHFVEVAQIGGDYNTIIENGMSILNDKKYQSVLPDCSKEVADIFYVFADCYFEEQLYQEAGSYYEKAIALIPDNADYYRDYAISEARMEHMESAEDILELAKEKGLETDSISLVEAEISFAVKEYEKAEELFKRVIDLTDNDYLRIRAYLLYAKALNENGDGEKEIKVLEEVTEYALGAEYFAVLRSLGAAYMKSGRDDPSYQKKAVKCYESIHDNGFFTLNDALNLASLYQKEKKFKQGKELLENMQDNYPYEYQIPMQLAFLCCAEQGEKDNKDRDYIYAEAYYKKARKLYEKKKNSGENDVNMDNLEMTMSQLYEKGWLEK